MPIVHITSIEDPRVAVFHSLTEQQLRNRLHPEQALFIAESPKVINVALAAGYQPLSLLCEEKHIQGDARSIIERFPAMPVYTGNRQILTSITGYTLTRGVLCAMHRPEPIPLNQVCNNAHRLVVIQGVTDTTNIGAIFRSAAALGIDGVLLTPDSCDPLNRRSIRVSMGSVFLVPWTRVNNPIDELHQHQFVTAAMALTNQSRPLDDPLFKTLPRLALIMGTEGDGLPHSTISTADYVIRIPMHHKVDSLNVAAATAVACWELRFLPDSF